MPETAVRVNGLRKRFGDVQALEGIAYEAVVTVATVGLAVRLFNSDRVVTGDAGRLGDVFSALQR